MATRIARLKECLALSSVNHKLEILKELTFKAAHSYCVANGVSAQQFGPLLELFLINKFGYKKNNASLCIGDCAKGGSNTEVKASLGGSKRNEFNYVQLRPSHKIDSYLLTAYYLSKENVEAGGDLYVFRVPKVDMCSVILNYGGYAHGTNSEHGRINMESLQDPTSKKEYAIRPSFGDACWRDLLKFRISEEDL